MPTYKTPLYVATATALMLVLPPLGDGRHVNSKDADKGIFQPLDVAISRLVAGAVAPLPYQVGTSQEFFSLVAEVAGRLIRESKPLDPDFSSVVTKEFWNLLK